MAEKGVLTRRLALVAGTALLITGLGVLVAFPVTAQAPDGYSVRCGTAMHKDDAAIKKWRLDQLERELGTQLGVTEGAAGTHNSDLGLSPYPGPTGGMLSIGPNPFAEKELDIDDICDKALSRTRGWSIALILLGFALFAVGAAARIKSLAEGGRLPTRVRNCPEWVTIVVFAASGAIGLLTSLTKGAAQWFWLCAAVLMFLIGALLTAARAGENKRQQKEVQNFLGNHLYGLLELIVEAASTDGQSDRRQLCKSARLAIIAAAANLVGRKARQGTRANLFRLDASQETMPLEPGGFWGR
ncbi:hypothetical protein [Mycolicibacterium mageritense]|uniref:hypothetical protein n=1 Tax=Mycolicibacterium mageritense TaxID=53462 RepID=UPI0011D3F91C|nr:hypothetical protein [Mycolicibacterium mageritense]TXI62211.1 MAG: hypothetical protein E6Q55_13670 [Mycolicibacterium mageritense]